MSPEEKTRQLIETAEKKKKAGKNCIIVGVVLFLVMGVFALFDVAPDEGPMVLGWAGCVLLGVGFWKLLNAPSAVELRHEQIKQARKLEEEKNNEELKPLINEYWPEQNLLAVCFAKDEDADGWTPLFRVSLVAEKGELRLKAVALGNSESVSFPVKESNGNLYVLDSGDFYPLTKKEVNTKSAVFVLCGEDSGLSVIPKAYEMLFSGKVLAAIQCGEKPLNEVPNDLLAMMPYFNFQLNQPMVTTNYKLGHAIVDNYFCAVSGNAMSAWVANRLVYDYYKANGLPQFNSHDIVNRSEALNLEISRLDLALTRFANSRGIFDNVPDIEGDPSMVITQLNACNAVFAKLVSLEKTEKYVFAVSRCKVKEGVLFELVNTLNVIGNISVKYKVIVELTEKGNIIIGMDDHLFVAAGASIKDEDFGKYYVSKDLHPINACNLSKYKGKE